LVDDRRVENERVCLARGVEQSRDVRDDRVDRLGPDTDPGVLVTVEQGELPPEVPLEELLAQIEWPEEVRGAAVVVERLVLPPSAGEVPVDPEEAAAFAAGHPDREEVRIVAAARRPQAGTPAGSPGSTYCAMRLRSRDDDFAVLEAPDLVPGLLDLLLSTLGAAPQTPGTETPGTETPGTETPGTETPEDQ
jgi:hypothetical protein